LVNLFHISFYWLISKILHPRYFIGFRLLKSFNCISTTLVSNSTADGPGGGHCVPNREKVNLSVIRCPVSGFTLTICVILGHFPNLMALSYAISKIGTIVSYRVECGRLQDILLKKQNQPVVQSRDEVLSSCHLFCKTEF
jgi:hypothetical protein